MMSHRERRKSVTGNSAAGAAAAAAKARREEREQQKQAKKLGTEEQIQQQKRAEEISKMSYLERLAAGIPGEGAAQPEAAQPAPPTLPTQLPTDHFAGGAGVGVSGARPRSGSGGGAGFNPSMRRHSIAAGSVDNGMLAPSRTQMQQWGERDLRTAGMGAIGEGKGAAEIDPSSPATAVRNGWQPAGQSTAALHSTAPVARPNHATLGNSGGSTAAPAALDLMTTATVNVPNFDPGDLMSGVVAQMPQMASFSMGSSQRDDQAAALTKLINTIGIQPQFFRKALDSMTPMELRSLGDGMHSLANEREK